MSRKMMTLALAAATAIAAGMPAAAQTAPVTASPTTAAPSAAPATAADGAAQKGDHERKPGKHGHQEAGAMDKSHGPGGRHDKKSGHRRGGPAGGQNPMILGLSKAFDADGDGKITQAESEAGMAALIAKHDANEDGALQLDEYEALQTELMRPMTEKMFARLDGDGNGTIDQAEAAVAAQRLSDASSRHGGHRDKAGMKGDTKSRPMTAQPGAGDAPATAPADGGRAPAAPMPPAGTTPSGGAPSPLVSPPGATSPAADPVADPAAPAAAN